MSSYSDVLDSGQKAPGYIPNSLPMQTSRLGAGSSCREFCDSTVACAERRSDIKVGSAMAIPDALRKERRALDILEGTMVFRSSGV